MVKKRPKHAGSAQDSSAEGESDAAGDECATTRATAATRRSAFFHTWWIVPGISEMIIFHGI